MSTEVPSRPPDTVTYSEWLPDHDDPSPERRLVPVYALAAPFEFQYYHEMVVTRQKRKRLERWVTPARAVPVLDPSGAMTFAVKHEPEQVFGRWEWEYRR